MDKPKTELPDEVAGVADNGSWEKWRAITAAAYARFHEHLLANRPLFPRLANFASSERVDATSGTAAWWWGAAGEIQETINSVNAWGMRLHEWRAWNQVVGSYEIDDDKWEVLYHFVEPVAFFCMLQPSGLADRMMVASETILHQANRCIFPGEPDRLDQDLRQGKPLRRSDRRKQLNRLGKRWSKFDAFREALSEIDGADYRKATRNFRDLSSHSFAPRLMTGQVVRAIRSVVPWEEMVVQTDGTYSPVAHPTQKSVQYAMQADEPLPLDATHSANLAEYQKALTAMDAFAVLVDELCDQMDAPPKKEAAAK